MLEKNDHTKDITNPKKSTFKINVKTFEHQINID